jgi:hypothetical protein
MAMTNQKPAVMNPFTRNPSTMRRDTRDTRWVPSLSSGTVKKPAPARQAKLRHQPSVARSQAASFGNLSLEEVNQRGQRDSNESSYSYDQESPMYDNTDAHSRRDSSYCDDTNGTSPRTPSPHTSTYVLPKTGKSSPISSDSTHWSDSPRSSIKHIGWGHLNDGVEEESSLRNRKVSNATLFPRFSYTIPSLPTKSTKESKGRIKAKKEKEAANSKPYTPYPDPVIAEQTVLRSSATTINTAPKVADFFRSAKQIYASGPKGEGRKVLQGIQTKRELNKQLKHKQRQKQLNIIYEERRQAHEQQLQDMYTAAANFQKPPCPKSPSPFISPTPPRPRSAEPLGVSRRVSLTFKSDIFKSHKGNKTKQRESGRIDTQDNANAYSPSTQSVTLGASASVQYDAQEVFVEFPNPPPRVPKLAPAPRPKGQVPMDEIGLTPPSVNEPVMPKPKPTVKKQGLPPPPISNTIPPVGTHSHRFVSQTKLQWFAGLDDRQTELERQKRMDKKTQDHAWVTKALDSLFDVELLADPFRKPHADRATTRKQKQLKASISQPIVISLPGDSIAGSAQECGHADEPAAAVKNGKDKETARAHTPPPPFQPHMQGQTEKSVEARAKKEYSRGWLDWIPSHEGVGKSFYSAFHSSHDLLGGGRQRADSDASFACQGIDVTAAKDYAYETDARADTLYQSERARAPAIYVSDEDAHLVPEPLLSNGVVAPRGFVRELSELDVRDTRFYAYYDELLRSYGN